LLARSVSTSASTPVAAYAPRSRRRQD
jgi:hypothetical protein